MKFNKIYLSVILILFSASGFGSTALDYANQLQDEDLGQELQRQQIYNEALQNQQAQERLYVEQQRLARERAYWEMEQRRRQNLGQ